MHNELGYYFHKDKIMDQLSQLGRPYKLELRDATNGKLLANYETPAI